MFHDTQYNYHLRLLLLASVKKKSKKKKKKAGACALVKPYNGDPIFPYKAKLYLSQLVRNCFQYRCFLYSKFEACLCFGFLRCGGERSTYVQD